jgi:hypothetical protein
MTSESVKKLVIIHGRPREDGPGAGVSDNQKHWIPWLKEQAEKAGYEVYNPQMPEPWQPEYVKWKSTFSDIPVDENTVLVGHSAGSAFLVRWLADTKIRIHKLILVAPAKYSGPHKRRAEMYDFEIDSEVRNLVKDIVVISSDDDDEFLVQHAKEYTRELSARKIELTGKGHCTLTHMGTREFPELLAEVI